MIQKIKGQYPFFIFCQKCLKKPFLVGFKHFYYIIICYHLSNVSNGDGNRMEAHDGIGLISIDLQKAFDCLKYY